MLLHPDLLSMQERTPVAIREALSDNVLWDCAEPQRQEEALGVYLAEVQEQVELTRQHEESRGAASTEAPAGWIRDEQGTYVNPDGQRWTRERSSASASTPGMTRPVGGRKTGDRIIDATVILLGFPPNKALL